MKHIKKFKLFESKSTYPTLEDVEKAINYTQYIKESKFWYKSIPEFLNWLDSKSNRTFVFIDTETTGLMGPTKEQLTQISAISSTYNFNENRFTEIDSFNKKIKLTDESKLRLKDKSDRIAWVLSFNHYGQSGQKYYYENLVLNEFHKWVSQYPDSILVIQNAAFDMKMINLRNKNIKFINEVLDTKDILQMFYLPCLLKLSESNETYKKIIDNIGISDRDNGLISSSMSKIGPALGIDMNNYHDALSDCRITTTMTEKIINFLKENQKVDITKYQIERIKTKK